MNAQGLYDQTRMASQITIKSMMLCECDPFVNQFKRSYSANTTGDVVGSIHDRVAQVGFSASNVVGGLFSGSLSNFVSPQTQAHAVDIPNGWGQRRYFFRMEVDIRSQLGTKTEVVTGFTDGDQVSMNGHISPDMVFYIDTVTTIRYVPTTVGGQQFVATRVQDSVHVLTNFNAGEMTSPWQQSVDMMRPQDLYSNIMVSQMDTHEVLDTRTKLFKPATSRRTNNTQSDYVARVISGALSQASEHAYGMDGPSIFAGALTQVQEKALSDIDFVKMLQQASAGIPTSNFTWGDLMRLTNGGVDQFTKIVHKGSHALTRVADNPFVFGALGNNSNESDSLQSQSRTALAATMISNALPSHMLMCGFGDAMFRVSNAYSTDPMQPATLAWESTPGSLTQGHFDRAAVQRLENLIINDLMHAVSYGNQLLYDVTVRCHVFGRLEIEIRLENDHARFVSPGFAGSIFSPITSSGTGDLGNLSSAFNYLLSDVLQQSPQTAFAEGYAQPAGSFATI